MASVLPKGFKYLPITAASTAIIISIPLAVSVLDWKPYFLFAWNPFITEWNQFWRLLILQLQFQNESEVIIGVILIVLKFKGLERLFGSLKMFKILVLLCFYNMITLSLTAMFLYYTIGWNLYIPSGPFGLLFGLLYPYNKYTPVVYQLELDFSNVSSFRPFGEVVKLTLSDNFTSHILSGLLFFSEGIVSSTIPCLVGYFVSYLYFNDLVPFVDSSLTFVDFIYNKFIIHNENETVVGDTINSSETQPADLSVDEPELESRDDTPVRTLGQQFLDTFRR